MSSPPSASPSEPSPSHPTFLGLDGEEPSYGEARAVILPMPFERTVSYGTGTADGPRALLEASAYIELYDEELDTEPRSAGFFTASPCSPDHEDLGTCLHLMANEAEKHMVAGKFVVVLGGEHSLTSAPARAAQQVFGPEIGVVQFDAHADLRDSYEGSRYSHASVMRRLVDDLGMPSLAVGLRSLSTPEARWIREHDLPVIWSHELHRDALRDSTERFERLLERLPDRIYLTFDIDYFDPSLVPATGTPEPGGGTWHPTLGLLRTLFARKQVVAMDVVELAPTAGQPSSDFVAAKLVHKALGYRFAPEL